MGCDADNPSDCLFQQQARAVQVAGTKRGPTSHRSTEQLSRSGEIRRLLAGALGDIKRIRNSTGQQQSADVLRRRC